MAQNFELNYKKRAQPKVTPAVATMTVAISM